MKIYLVLGHHPYTEESEEYSNYIDWSLTLTSTYRVEAYKEKARAKNKLKELQDAVSLWNRALANKTLMDGVRGNVFLQELAEKVGDQRLSTDSTYDLDIIEVKE